MNAEERPAGAVREGKVRISAVIVARNAGTVIAECLESVRWCDEIVVVDLGSTDDTLAIARRYTERVISHTPFDHEEPAKEFAFAQASGDWVFHLNPWERCPAVLAQVLREAAERDPAVNGFKVPIQTYVLGHRFQRTGVDPAMTEWRFFRPTTVRQSARLNRQPTLFGVGAVLSSETHDIAIRSELYPTVETLFAEINRLTTIEARQTFELGGQINWSHMVAAAAAEFVTRYRNAHGYEDGMPGFLFSVAMALYAFLTTAKVWEMQLAAGTAVTEPPPDLEAVIGALQHGAAVAGFEAKDSTSEPAPASDQVSEASWGRLGTESVVEPVRQVSNPGRILIGDRVTVGPGACFDLVTGDEEKANRYDPLVTIGDDTVIGRDLTVRALNQVLIGQHVRIGDGVTIHDFDPLPVGQPPTPGWVVIAEEVTIGDGARIGPRVRLGLGAQVEPGAVVRQDVPPYTRVAGNPACPVAQYDPTSDRWLPIEVHPEPELPPSVSVVVPVTGDDERVRLTYQAVQLAAGTSLPWELVLVDCRGDSDLGRRFADLPDEVCVVENTEPVSLLRAVNQAATIARGKYLVVLPPTLVPLSGWLDELVRAAEEDPQLAVVAPRVLSYDGTTVAAGGWIRPDGQLVLNTPRPPRLDLPALVHFAPEYGCLLRLDVLVAAGGLDERYQTSRAAFADYGLLVKASGHRVACFPLAVVVETDPVAPDAQLLERDRREFLAKWSVFAMAPIQDAAA
jgi:carbonic anhydrase/acetyltransferase-like protein (isoleucine patch superfamily)